MSSESSSNERSQSEKLMLLLDSKNVSEADIGEWLRQNDFHSQHLELWEQEFRTLLEKKNSD